MRKFSLLVLLIILTFSAEANSNRDSLVKIAAVVHFRIDCKNPGIENEVLLAPLYHQLKRVFKIDTIINLQPSTILWSDIFRLKEEKELSGEDILNVNRASSDLIISIKVEHWLGSLILAKGKKHAMQLTCTIFNKSGKRVWDMKKKDSCCRSVEIGSAEFTEADYPIDKETFLKLYESVIKLAFGKF